MSETQSEPPSRPRRMSLVAERQVPDLPASPVSQQIPVGATLQAIPTPRTLPPELQREALTRLAWKQGVIASLNVAAQILAARLILLLATMGAFGLTWVAIQTAQPLQLGAVALYLAGVILPLVWLSGRR